MNLRIRAFFSSLWLAARLFCAGDPVIVSPEHQRRRVAICRDCPYRSEGLLDSCSVCGCSIQAKAILLHPGCPKGKWSDLDGKASLPVIGRFFRTPRVSLSHA